jgi:hypothetical protein
MVFMRFWIIFCCENEILDLDCSLRNPAMATSKNQSYNTLPGPALGLGHECDGLGPSPERGPEFLMHKYVLLSPIFQPGPASM